MVGKIFWKSKWQYCKKDQFCIYADCRDIPHVFQQLSPGLGKTQCPVSCCCSPKSFGALSYMTLRRKSTGLRARRSFLLPGLKQSNNNNNSTTTKQTNEQKGKEFLSSVKGRGRSRCLAALLWKTSKRFKQSLLCIFMAFVWGLLLFFLSFFSFFFCTVRFLQHRDFANSVWYQSRKFCQRIYLKTKARRSAMFFNFISENEQFIRSAYLMYLALFLHNSSLALEANTWLIISAVFKRFPFLDTSWHFVNYLQWDTAACIRALLKA